MAAGAGQRASRRAAQGASIRVPGTLAAPPPRPPEDGRPSLRLAAARAGLSLELDRPFPIGPARVTGLAVTIGDIKFPLDLSGGVARFRHRRGVLEALFLEVGAAELSAFARTRLRGLLAPGSPEVTIAPSPAGALVGVRQGERALAFEVAIAPAERDLRLVPTGARGIGLDRPPHAAALSALGLLVGSAGRLVEGALVLPDVARAVATRVLPEAGARAPSVEGFRIASARAALDRGSLVLEGRRGAAPAALAPEVISALETCELAGSADEALARGDAEGARALYLEALERAPRHREISARLAWLDRSLGGRDEAALATLVDACPAAFAGLLGAELLAAVGDAPAAAMALRRAAEEEPYGPMAALAWARSAELEEFPAARREALDQAVARAPALEGPRWARLSASLRLGDLRAARADAEHLEASARGSTSRFEAASRAAAHFLEAGYPAEAAALYERALRYAPERPEAIAGLARSLGDLGRSERALDLLARARVLAERQGGDVGALDLALARALASVVGDLPAAVARARAVPPDHPGAPEARYLEARLRADLGDLVGASQAFGRLREAVERVLRPEPAQASQLALWLCQAADIERNACGDSAAALLDLGLALRLRPRDRKIALAYRDLAARRATPPPAGAPEPVEPGTRGGPPVEASHVEASHVEASHVEAPHVEAPHAEASHVEAPHAEEPHVEASHAEEYLEDAETTGEVEDEPGAGPPEEAEELASAGEEGEEPSEAEDEETIARLTDRIRANPADTEAAVGLADALERRGRTLELLALASARVEEGDEAQRAIFGARRAAALRRLAEEARAAGRDSEAELYESMLDA